MPGSERQNSMFKKTRGYVQEGNPIAVTSCGRRRNTGQSIVENDSPPIGYVTSISSIIKS